MHGDPLPQSTLDACLAADAVLLGAIGGPKWGPSAPVRPEQGLLRLRRELGVYANLRPIKLHPALRDASVLKPEILDGVDLVFVRELTGGIYFGAKTRTPTLATDLCSYSARKSSASRASPAGSPCSAASKIVSIDKSNVLETSRLWREVADARDASANFPTSTLEHMLVDSAAMHLLKRPRDFDVHAHREHVRRHPHRRSRHARELARCVCRRRRSATAGAALYEPIHGSAPDIAGKGIANPIGTILSVALLLRHSLGLEREARDRRAGRGSLHRQWRAHRGHRRAWPAGHDHAPHGRRDRRRAQLGVDPATYRPVWLRHTRWYGDPWPRLPRIPERAARRHHRPGARQWLRGHAR